MRLLQTLALALVVAIATVGCDPKTTADDGFMFVFSYEGKFIPVEQLYRAEADVCKATHLHASGIVRSLQNEVIPEPDDPCGFGEALKVIEVPIPDDYAGAQRASGFYFNRNANPGKEFIDEDR